MLYRIIASSGWPTHNIVPHISWHDLPYCRTMNRYEGSQRMEAFLFHPLKFWIQTWFCNCPQCLCLYGNVVECTLSIHDPGKMLVLPNKLLCWVDSTSDQCFVSFQPIWCHPHTQIRIILFDGVRIDIPNLELSPNRALIGFSQIVFPISVLPKDGRTYFAQEELLGLPYWTMIQAIRVVVNESTYLDIAILELFNNLREHLPFWPGYNQILRPLLVHRNKAIWRWYPWLLLLSFVMMILIRWILRETLYHLWSYHRGLQLDLCTFGALSPIQHFSNDISLLHRSPRFCFWLLSCSTPDFSPIFPFLIHCCLCCWDFHSLRHKN